MPGRIEDGRVVGLGASDMKGGIAVMIELARWAADGDRAARPRVPLLRPRGAAGRGERRSRACSPRRRSCSSPTSSSCSSRPTTRSTPGASAISTRRSSFHGESAHSARPWQGVNAIDLAVRGSRRSSRRAPLEVEVGGLTFVEVLSATRIHGGIASNVIPDRVEVGLNYRYAPNRTPDEAEARLRELVGADELEITSNSPPAHVATDSPLVAAPPRGRAISRSSRSRRGRRSRSSPAQGLDAVNLGPGATRYAHKRDEQVEIAELERCFETLAALRSS